MKLRARWRAVGLALAALASPARPALAQSASFEQLQAFSSLLNYIRQNYVDSVGYTELVRAAMVGTLHALDPHSSLVSAADWRQRSALERGELATPGMAVEDVDSAVSVIALASRGPADRAGLMPGDRIIAVNDTVVAGQNAKTIELRLAGEKGSKVRVRLERGSRFEPDTFSVTLKRDFFEQKSVTTWAVLDGGTGYVRLREFGPRAGDELSDAIDKLRGKGATRLLLDLRGNPGGLVIEAVDIAGLFLPKGSLVFRTRGRRAAVDVDYVTKRDGRFQNLPLIVLIDERSASAAEALAASLQDNDRALLLGRRSFGKALMQSVFLIAATEDNVWLTIGRVISPSGRIIQRRYKGLLYEQYRSLEGQGGAAEDTLAEYHTHRGRLVRGGGGVLPDVVLPAPPGMPVWWSVAKDSSFDDAVADSVAATLSADPQALRSWAADPDGWRARLVPPLLARIRTRLQVVAAPTPAVERRLAAELATRAASVRWGQDAAVAVLLRGDDDVRAAAEHFDRLPTLLGGR